jgi:superfamily II DNA or RNA helicase
MELRKCCNHPFLIAGVEDKEMEDIQIRNRMTDVMVPSSGKMILLDKLLPKLRAEGHKVLIFSQMVRMIELIQDYCVEKNYSCEKLTGAVKGNERQKSIDRFNTDENSFIFLLSTRAGGVGINLTAADTCIIFDSDWNPQNDVQAMARCHRIGQEKNVKIYRLITRKSFEAEMFERASRKLGLEQAVLGTADFAADTGEEGVNVKQDKAKAKLDAAEMEQLLREGAYAMLLEGDDTDLNDFREASIDELLVSRSHKIVTEGNKQTSSWLNKKKKSGRTKRSRFAGEEEKEHIDIDVNDPDFWTKVLPDLVSYYVIIVYIYIYCMICIYFKNYFIL